MGRPKGPLVRCSGTKTEAEFTTRIKNILRGESRKWKPTQDCKKYARVSRGMYKCAECMKVVPCTHKMEGRPRPYIFVDHIAPVVDPHTGFTTWDSFIEGLFSELPNLQLLCKPCHDVKCAEETKIATARRAKEKK